MAQFKQEPTYAQQYLEAMAQRSGNSEGLKKLFLDAIPFFWQHGSKFPTGNK
jgi:hypothetical protein